MRSAVPEIAAPALSRLPPPPTYSTERDRPPMDAVAIAPVETTPATVPAVVVETASAMKQFLVRPRYWRQAVVPSGWSAYS